MCPLCIANIAILASASSGGVVALALKTFRSRRKHKEKGQDNESNRTGIRSRNSVSAGMGDCAPTASCEGKGVNSRPRRVGRRTSADAVAGRGKGLHV